MKQKDDETKRSGGKENDKAPVCLVFHDIDGNLKHPLRSIVFNKKINGMAKKWFGRAVDS